MNSEAIKRHAEQTYYDPAGTLQDCPYIEGTDEYNYWMEQYNEIADEQINLYSQRGY